MNIAADRDDLPQHHRQFTGNRDVLHRKGDGAILDPEPRGCLRIGTRDRVDGPPDQLSAPKSPIQKTQQRRCRSGGMAAGEMQVADAIGIARRLKAELARVEAR